MTRAYISYLKGCKSINTFMIGKLLRCGACLGWFCAAALAQTGAVKSDGEPIPGATVKATQGQRVLTTVTEASGAFQLSGMTSGAWVVEVDMFGFEHARKDVQVAAGPTRIDFTLQLGQRRTAQRGQIPAAAANTEPGATLAEPIFSVGSEPVSGIPVEGSNESFLVNGSVSQGLQTQAADFRPDLAFGPGGFGGGPGLFLGQPGQPAGTQDAQPGAPTPPQAPGPGIGGGGRGGRGGGPGGGGPAGGPPGFGGGGFAGGGGGGGRGGFGGGRGGGGRGGRGPRDRNGNPAFIGNRRPNNNRITGSLFYRVGNSVLNARPFSVNGLEQPKAAYGQNYFGFSAGGPLFFPKLFDLSKINWFLDYNGTRIRNGSDTALSFPTAAQRLGDFSGTGITIYDPATHSPFPNNRIPAKQLNPIAIGLLNHIPLPNQSVSGVNRNYRYVYANPTNNDSLNSRVNANLSQKDQLAFAMNYQSRQGSTFNYFGCCDTNHGTGMNANVNWRHRLGTRMFNNLTVTSNRNTNNLVPFFAFGPDIAGQLGIQGTSPDPRNFGPPSLSFTNFSGLNDGTWTRSAVFGYGLSETLQIRRGKNNFSVGGGYTRSLNNTTTDQNGRGSYSFSSLATADYDANGLPIANTGYDLASFLLGLPETSSIRYGDSSTYFRSNSYNAFFVDDYRVNSSLSLNLGLRYEYFSPWSEKYGHIANLDVAPNFSSVAAVIPGQTGALSGNVYPASLINPDRNNLGPRLALAWRPVPKRRIIVRAGYGIYYNPGQYNQFASRLAAQPPFAVTNNVTTSTDNILTLGSGLVALPPGTTVTNTFGVNLNYTSPYVQSWNVSIQSDLPYRLQGELLYTGTKGTHLDISESPNQAAPGSALTSEQRQSIANAVNFNFHDPVGNSIYHAAQLRLTRRMQAGASFNFQYTFAKSIDDLALAQNFFNQAAERALSNNDRRHVVSLNYVLTSPVDSTHGFLAHPVWAAKAFKDWTISGGITAQTGTPLTPTIAGNLAGTGSQAPLRANATGLPVDAGTGYFNAAAFVIPAAGTFGTAGRNTITGPGSVIANLSLARSINLHSERRRLEIRVDANNFLNHVNPNGLITTVNSSQYGLITNAGQMRQLTATMRLRF
jgi:hypothetical protein